MPISPTVSAYMAQGQGQPQGNDQDSLFKKSFSDHAFNSLRAKAPAIIPYVTTFKTFEFSIDDGDAFGSFVLSYGSDLVFIPVVMANGSIASCEMAYIRDEDRFVPLSEDFIKKIVNKNNSTLASPMEGSVRVEDTRQMFRNLIRPPMSSNVVFASRRMDISELPDSAKAQMAEYLKANPRLLAKIAEVYPIEVLGEKLAAAGSDEPMWGNAFQKKAPPKGVDMRGRKGPEAYKSDPYAGLSSTEAGKQVMNGVNELTVKGPNAMAKGRGAKRPDVGIAFGIDF